MRRVRQHRAGERVTARRTSSCTGSRTARHGRAHRCCWDHRKHRRRRPATARRASLPAVPSVPPPASSAAAAPIRRVLRLRFPHRPCRSIRSHPTAERLYSHTIRTMVPVAPCLRPGALTCAIAAIRRHRPPGKDRTLFGRSRVTTVLRFQVPKRDQWLGRNTIRVFMGHGGGWQEISNPAGRRAEDPTDRPKRVKSLATAGTAGISFRWIRADSRRGNGRKEGRPLEAEVQFDGLSFRLRRLFLLGIALWTARTARRAVDRGILLAGIPTPPITSSGPFRRHGAAVAAGFSTGATPVSTFPVYGPLHPKAATRCTVSACRAIAGAFDRTITASCAACFATPSSAEMRSPVAFSS